MPMPMAPNPFVMLLLWPVYLAEAVFKRCFAFEAPEFDFTEGVVKRMDASDTPWKTHKEVRADSLRRSDMIHVDDRVAPGLDFVEGVAKSLIPYHVEVITTKGKWIVPARRKVKRFD